MGSGSRLGRGGLSKTSDLGSGPGKTKANGKQKKRRAEPPTMSINREDSVAQATPARSGPTVGTSQESPAGQGWPKSGRARTPMIPIATAVPAAIP